MNLGTMHDARHCLLGSVKGATLGRATGNGFSSGFNEDHSTLAARLNTGARLERGCGINILAYCCMVSTF